jgi:hypothetical protein
VKTHVVLCEPQRGQGLTGIVTKQLPNCAAGGCTLAHMRDVVRRQD